MKIARIAAGDIVKFGLVEGNTVKGLKYSPFSQLGSAFETEVVAIKLMTLNFLHQPYPRKSSAWG